MKFQIDRRSVVKVALLQSILTTKFFDELRTRKQLGYVARLQQITEGGRSYLLTLVEGLKCCLFWATQMR